MPNILSESRLFLVRNELTLSYLNHFLLNRVLTLNDLKLHGSGILLLESCLEVVSLYTPRGGTTMKLTGDHSMDSGSMDLCHRGHKSRDLVLLVDVCRDGVAFSQHAHTQGDDLRDYYSLDLEERGNFRRPLGRFVSFQNRPEHELEVQLMNISRKGLLRSTTVYLGSARDPFFPFEKRFDTSMKILSLFERYLPGRLVVQTRSPLVVIAMPVLRKLGSAVGVTIAVETSDDDVVRKYTPGLPRITDRLQASRALRRLGVEVTLQAAPLLPYGDWRSDAERFATLLVENGDFVYVRGFYGGSAEEEKRCRVSKICKALQAARKFHWLRSDSANPLISALEEMAPNKLLVPAPKKQGSAQLSLFAA